MTTKSLLNDYVWLRDELGVRVEAERPRKRNDTMINGKWPAGDPMDYVLAIVAQGAAMDEVGNA